jgi:hypothetical protein
LPYVFYLLNLVYVYLLKLAEVVVCN